MALQLRFRRMLVMLIFFSTAISSACVWPIADVLYIMDGTLGVDQFEFKKEISFISQNRRSAAILELVNLSCSDFFQHENLRTGVINQRCPVHSNGKTGDRLRSSAVHHRSSASVGGLCTGRVVDDMINVRFFQKIAFSPCDVLSDRTRCNPRASINSLAGVALQSANRKWLPDVVVVISSAKYRIPETLSQETLFSPQSPLHIFYIIIGGPSPDESRFEPSATTIRLSAVDFSALERLVLPLCETISNDRFHCSGSTRVAAFGSTCWLVTGIMAAVFILTVLILGYSVYAYRRQGKQLEWRLKEMEKTLRTQNEFFTAKLHSQMEEQIKTSEKHAEELRKHNETMQAHQLELQRQRELSAAPPTASVLQAQPIVFPYMPPNSVLAQQSPNNGMASGEPFLGNQAGNRPSELHQHSDKRSELGDQSSDSKGQISKRDDELMLRLDKLEETLAKRSTEAGPTELTSSPEHLLNINPPNSITEEDSSDGATDDSGYNARGDTPTSNALGHLPSNHPARNLPPIDLLLLVDSSSSIGISNFESVKANLADILEDVDISPGRSRVALIQYALQPSVVFDFDKYYSLKSVQRGVERMSYTGGATMLSKALSFAAGLLYREQNMKDMKKRKHKLMPTPRHDRLQVLCLVSDGASDDNVDKATAYLHEKLQIKILAIVTRHFNKDRLLSITRFEGSIFVMDQKESISIWLWRQQRSLNSALQKMWAENYSAYIQREKSLPLSHKRSPKKSSRVAGKETSSESSNSI
ncbi:unnamed protein product [Nippostrongylus brasiliensis]|uniref:VWFA domain-containing protein n=1 Tax=Nippostrongylus brasiliensis TaxID=27835 RepID=A0A0N4YGW1_NIPBR|nr:unnamed protein product [Nippostrongylus brasiliensis]